MGGEGAGAGRNKTLENKMLENKMHKEAKQTLVASNAADLASASTTEEEATANK